MKKKITIGALVLVVILSLGFNVHVIWGTLKNVYYQSGVKAGQQAYSTELMRQIGTGRVELVDTATNKKIVLIPQKDK